MPSGHQHRASSSLRQSNKKNKRSLASKRSVNRIAGGKILKAGGGSRALGRHSSHKNGASVNNKEKRTLMAKQRREMQRRKIIAARRFGSGSGGGSNSHNNNDNIDLSPKLIGVISLTAQDATQADALEKRLPQLLLQQSSMAKKEEDKINGKNTFEFESFKRSKITVLTNSDAFSYHYHVQNSNTEERDNNNSNNTTNAIMGALDLCRVCDVIVFTLNGDIVHDTIADNQVGGSSSGMSVGGRSTSTMNTTTTTSDLCDELFISERGEEILSACKAQGLPTVLTLLLHSHDSAGTDSNLHHREKAKLAKRRNEMKRFGQRLATSEFGENVRFMDVSLPSTNNNSTATVMMTDTTTTTSSSSSSSSAEQHHNDANTLALIRFLSTGAASPPKWVDTMPRPYLVTTTSTASNGHVYNPDTKELHLTGHIRGTTPLCIDNFVHVPNLGTYTLSKITVTATEEEIVPSSEEGQSSSSPEATMFAMPDALEGEQNLIGFDEEGGDNDNDDDNDDEDDAPEARPAGWSDYQSAWLDGIDTDNHPDEEEKDFGELAKALNAKKIGGSSSNTVGGDDITMDGFGDDDDDDNKISESERKLHRKEDLEFPDEVELKQDELARDRLARYRSLRSFRNSFWDPKENLPEAYARVYHFASFKNTQRDIMADQEYTTRAMLKQFEKSESNTNNSNGNNKDVAMVEDKEERDDDVLDGCVFPGTHVTLTLSNVSAKLYHKQISTNAPISAVSLLPHESKVSVMHMGITSKYEEKDDTTTTKTPSAIKSKDILTFRCGWRTWQGRAVFSQNNLNSDKHKLERFLPPSGAFLAATVFGPVCYSPCPVLCFSSPTTTTSSNTASSSLVAVGSVMGADADRIVIKRIVMTGFPTRVHKRHATVKYMFYNPEDVKWFKPAGLTTKHGLQGNIVESVGDHGTMKCLFNQPVKQHDTVCLPLYKRIYPKFAPQPVEDDSGNITMKDLVVL